MSRPALAATRAVKILNFLAAHPGESFTLSDLAARVGVNLASAHALLSVLTDAGYLTRQPRLRTFTLGPAVVALGTAALESHPAIDMARDAARDLARDLGLEVAVTAAAGDSIVFLAHAGEPSARGLSILVGQQIPLLPPLGSVFVAWGGAEEWLARADDPAPLQEVLDTVRARGYSVALEMEARRGLNYALRDLADHPDEDQLRDALSSRVSDLLRGSYQATDLSPARSYDLSMIAAPIFGIDARPILALTLVGFASRLRGREVVAHGERLRDVGLVVTKRSRGRIPQADPLDALR